MRIQERFEFAWIPDKFLAGGCMKRLLFFLFLVSCGTEAQTDLKANRSEPQELSVRDATFRVRIQSYAEVDHTSGSPKVIVYGSANTPLESAFSFVPDDAFGEAQVVTPTTFELTLSYGYEINSLLSGLPILISLHDANSTDHYLRLLLKPVFRNFAGDENLFIEKIIDAVYVRDVNNPLRYRATAQTKQQTLGTSLVPADIGKINRRLWSIDWTYDTFATRLGYTVEFSAGEARKKAETVVRVARVEMTTDDPYNAWPTDVCEDRVLNCIQAHSDKYDLSICGNYREVQRCINQH
jgi:hypothetical protein